MNTIVRLTTFYELNVGFSIRAFSITDYGASSLSVFFSDSFSPSRSLCWALMAYVLTNTSIPASTPVSAAPDRSSSF